MMRDIPVQAYNRLHLILKLIYRRIERIDQTIGESGFQRNLFKISQGEYPLVIYGFKPIVTLVRPEDLFHAVDETLEVCLDLRG